MAEFYSRALFVPGHVGIAAKGVEYKSGSEAARAALKVFTTEVQQISPAAYRLQGYSGSRIIFNAAISRLGQAVAGEIGLDEAYRRITDDVTQQIAERDKK